MMPLNWQILKIVLVLAFLIALIRFRVELWIAIFSTTLLTVFLFGIAPGRAVAAAFETIRKPSSLELLVVILLVQFIGAIQKKRNYFERMVGALTHLFLDKRIVTLVSPAIIGLLPMPGGALLSAPLVESSTSGMNISAAFKTFLNYWFRHIWEMVWPLYTSLLLFQALSGLSLKTIILWQLPFCLLHILTGAVIAFRYFRKHGVKADLVKIANSVGQSVRDFLLGTWHILLVVILFFTLSVPLYIGLSVASLLIFFWLRVTLAELKELFLSRTVIKSFLVIVFVLFFQGVISISNAFSFLNDRPLTILPIVLISFFISFTMGFLTGVNNAYIAIAYPLLAPLILAQPNPLYLKLFIYITGFAGILLSPMHLCLILTNEYFNSRLAEVYRYLLPPVFMMLLLAFGGIALLA